MRCAETLSFDPLWYKEDFMLRVVTIFAASTYCMVDVHDWPGNALCVSVCVGYDFQYISDRTSLGSIATHNLMFVSS